MTARFKDARIDRQGRLSLGRDHSTGAFYLSIPVSNARADYEEYFALDKAELECLRADTSQARAFAERCRAREHDDRLILKPGSDRGAPR